MLGLSLSGFLWALLLLLLMFGAGAGAGEVCMKVCMCICEYDGEYIWAMVGGVLGWLM